MSATAFLKNRYLVLLLCLFACNVKHNNEVLPYYNTPDFTPVFIKNRNEVAEKINHVIAPFAFHDQDGKIITYKTVLGKIHIADFMFTSCTAICPQITKNLIKLSKVFEHDTGVVMLSFSVAPWIDTEKKLKAYKEGYSITNPNWHFLTGDKSEIYLLARRSYFAEEDLGYSRDSSTFLHTEHIVLVDATGRIRGIYNGTLQLDIEQLIKDITTLKEEDE